MKSKSICALAFFFSVMMVYLSSCDDANLIDIPGVTVICDSATDCANNTADDNSGVVIVYWLDTAITCAATGVPSDYHARGQTILTPGSCSGGICTSPQFSVWVDTSINVITQLPSGTYQLCAKIDTSAVGGYETGEPYSTRNQAISSSAVTLDNFWADIP